MLKLLFEKIKESLFSVLPVFIIVIILAVVGHFTNAFPLTNIENLWTFVMFLIGSFMLVAGLSLFSLGADLSLLKVGEQVGNYLTNKRKLWLLLLVGFLIGIIITIAEPDLLVLAKSFSLPDAVLIIAVGVGVGVFLAVALLRIVLQVRLVSLLLVLYIITFILAFIVSINNPAFIPVAFDSGGVTTGPMTVPFILALGLGVAHARGGKKSNDDSFGLVALCSVGPIIAVLVLGLFTAPSGDAGAVEEAVLNFGQMIMHVLHTFGLKLGDVGLAILGITTFIIIFEFALLRIKFKKFIKIFVGLIYVLLGVAIFLAGAEIGFWKIGQIIGLVFGSSDIKWLIIPIGMVIGFFVVMAEPSVQVLNKQVEGITAGSISRKTMLFTLAIGVAISIGLSFLRIILQIPMLYILVPGYAIALILTLFAPKIFSAIAFDSGGVASGPMTATFLLPMATGLITALCENVEGSGGTIAEFSYGTVALVAMTPLIVIQILGLIYKIKTTIRVKAKERTKEPIINFDVDISKWIGE